MTETNAPQKRFVITGGPGSGKTTVLLELEKRGYTFVREAARQIIQEQTSMGGSALPWADRDLYTRLMLDRSVAAYEQAFSASMPLFFDRGIPDALCYARLVGVKDEEYIREASNRYRYTSPAFMAPPWEEIYRTDSERKQDFAEAVRTYDLMRSVYRECGYEIIELPKMPAAERAEFILREIRVV